MMRKALAIALGLLAVASTGTLLLVCSEWACAAAAPAAAPVTVAYALDLVDFGRALSPSRSLTLSASGSAAGGVEVIPGSRLSVAAGANQTSSHQSVLLLARLGGLASYASVVTSFGPNPGVESVSVTAQPLRVDADGTVESKFGIAVGATRAVDFSDVVALRQGERRLVGVVRYHRSPLTLGSMTANGLDEATDLGIFASAETFDSLAAPGEASAWSAPPSSTLAISGGVHIGLSRPMCVETHLSLRAGAADQSDVASGVSLEISLAGEHATLGVRDTMPLGGGWKLSASVQPLVVGNAAHAQSVWDACVSWEGTRFGTGVVYTHGCDSSETYVYTRFRLRHSLAVEGGVALQPGIGPAAVVGLEYSGMGR